MGRRLAWSAVSWKRSLRATESASPRTMATSSPGKSREGIGRRASVPTRPWGVGTKLAVMSSRSAMARMAAPVVRLNRSKGFSGSAMDRGYTSVALTPLSVNSVPKQR